MYVILKNGEKKQFHLEDVVRYQEYRSENNRWDERAFVFEDGSILWVMMGFSSYTSDGSKYITNGHVTVSGAHHDPTRSLGEFPIGIYDFVQELKRSAVKLTLEMRLK